MIITPEMLSKLVDFQMQAWQRASAVMSENVSMMVEAAPAEPVSVHTSDLMTELTFPVLAIEFTLSSMPARSQVLIINHEDAIALAGVITGDPAPVFNDMIAETLTPSLKVFTEEFYAAISGATGTDHSVQNLTVKAGAFSFPTNFLEATDVVQSVGSCKIGEEAIPFSIMWLLDCESLASLLGILKIEPAEDPFQQIDGLNLGSNTTELSLPQFEDSKSTEETGLELLLDIPLEVTVELGRVRMLIKEVVDLGPGSIVELDAVVGDPVDVMVNGRLVARGEVVVLGDNFGVRVSEIMSPTARLQRIGERE